MSLIGDMASCGGTNPLSQVNKMLNADNSLQRDHVKQNFQSGSLRGSERRILSSNDQQLLNSLQQHPGARDAFQFDELRKDLPQWEQSVKQPNRQWSAEFMGQNTVGGRQNLGPQSAASGPQNSAWTSEFHQQMSTNSQQYQPPVNPFMNMDSVATYSMPRMSFAPSVTSRMHPSQQPMAHHSNVSAGKISELKGEALAKWEKEFEKAERSASPSLSSATDTTAEASKEAVGETVGETLGSSAEEAQINNLDMHDISDEYVSENLENSQWFDNSYPPNWDEMWDKINQGEDGSARVRAEDFRATTGSYEFAKENEYSNEEDPFAMGVYMMDNGAKLSCAVLCFEEAVKRDPAHVEAWARLGDAQAQNEIEEQAIVALEKAVALNPRHERALLNLAISYTNEGYDLAASQILEKWILAKYPDIAELVPKLPDNSPRELLRSRVTDMFLKAAQRSPQTGLDPEVQVGLGVLFYRDEDFSKAVDCFRAALSVKPNDASLWNRLGATLANASRPEEAIDAYTKALALRPSFVRARYNLAVSCINIGCYKEAADHILSAIALHETEDGMTINFERSANLLDTLRRVFFAMDRRDLLAKLIPGATLNDFRGEFNF